VLLSQLAVRIPVPCGSSFISTTVVVRSVSKLVALLETLRSLSVLWK
jgi:hypothetical protein